MAAKKSFRKSFRDSLARVILGVRKGFTFSLFGQGEHGKISVERALKCATVFNCITIVSSGIGEVRFSAPENKQVNAVLRNPNEWQTGSEYIQGVAFDMLSYGDAYTRIVGGAKNPSMLVPEKPSDIRLDRTQRGKPIYTSIASGTDVKIQMANMLHCRDIGSHSAISVSRIEAAADRIRALMNADDLIADIFENGIAMSYIVKTTKRMQKKDMQDFGDTLKKQLGSAGKGRGSIIVLDAAYTVDPVEGLKPADADLRELRIHLIREIASIFGVPPFLAGGDSDTKYSNSTSRIATMYRGAFAPIINRIQSSLEHKFQTPIVADDTVLIKGDLGSQATIGAKLISGQQFTPNEVRKDLYGKPPVDGGDKLVSIDVEDDDRSGETPSDEGDLGDIPPELVVLP